jgi:ABC-type bacteriocin/lantibiotic exporter with double-glycine peptidase domain
LARALLRRPALLLLDEPTNSLDDQNERMVLETIEGLKGRVTMILVTDRPERVHSVDQMLCLERGRLQKVMLTSAFDGRYREAQR